MVSRGGVLLGISCNPKSPTPHPFSTLWLSSIPETLDPVARASERQRLASGRQRQLVVMGDEVAGVESDRRSEEGQAIRP